MAGNSSRTLTVRLDASEYASLECAAAALGLTVSNYVRRCLSLGPGRENGRPRKGPAERAESPKALARKEVARAVRLGKLSPAKRLPCVRCGRRARHWHHHKGYDPFHWLDVIPLCARCHCLIHAQERSANDETSAGRA